MQQEMQKQMWTVVLAGLFCDLGKFLQLEESNVKERNVSHRVVTGEFINERREYLSRHVDIDLLVSLILDGETSRTLQERNKTAPNAAPVDLSLLLRTAVKYASVEPCVSNPCSDKNHPLVSVFSRLQLDDDQPIAKIASYRTTVFSPEKCFPEKDMQWDAKAAANLIKQFIKEFDKVIPQAGRCSFEAIYTHIVALLYKYTWCIPWKTPDEVADISLFDHLITTSAIAAALFRYHEGQSQESSEEDSLPKFRLAVGDLSGIQKYIFNLASTVSGGVAKGLRARSFYLTTLTEAISHKIIHAFGLPLANIIMASGGKFYILLPNNVIAENYLDDLQAELDSYFMKEYNGEIAVNLAQMTFAGKDFQSFGRVFDALAVKLAERKGRPFVDYLVSEKGWREEAFVRPQMVEKQESICAACGINAGSHQYDVEGDKLYCAKCVRDTELGAKLVNSKYMVFGRHTGQFPLIGDYFISVYKDVPPQDQGYLVTKLNDPDLSNVAGSPAQFRFIANYIPTAESGCCVKCVQKVNCRCDPQPVPGQLLFFECLAARSTGKPLLGYLKADVDNLGSLFVFGLRRDRGNDNDSITRISTLSRLLELFFSARVNQLLKENYTNCYTVFSGGDDLFILGSWSEVVELVKHVHKEFTDFVGGNPQVTLSAGIALAKPKHPVASIVDLAEAALEEAKEQPAMGEQESRNQLSFMGHVMKWDKVREIFLYARQMADWIEENALSVAFARKLLYYGRLYEGYRDSGDIRGLRFISLLNYDIVRSNVAGEVREFLEGLKVITPNNVKLDYLQLIVKTALILTRG